MTTQTTLSGVIERSGIALHSGEQVAVRLHPAEPGTGVVFVIDGVPVSATVGHVVDTQLATTLARDAVRVRMVEHLLAACAGVGLDNVRVEVTGEEVPVLDGCAAAWVDSITDTGLSSQSDPRQAAVVLRPFEIVDGPRRARLLPADETVLDISIDFEHAHVGRQQLELTLTPGTFARELAWARTFGFERHVPAMRRMGLVRGGSLDNALVFGEDGVLNTGGLRAVDEPVRHKMLDVLGDLALLGAPLKGRLEAERPGHGLIVGLLRAALDAGDVMEFRGPPS